MQWKQGFLDGKVLLFDKPMEWTSFDVANKVRAIVKVKKVGHAGTLDPLATGLLIICTGKFTKKINEYMGMEKEYTGTFTLGATTPTYDLESDPENFQSIEHLAPEQIQAATAAFKGNILQLPPQHSAIKKNGERLYISARKGEFVEVEPRPVTIHAFEIEKIEAPLVYFKVVCSTGTYIRSLANDFGQALGVGAYMSSLRRTRIGQFSVDNATNLIDFEQEVLALRAAEAETGNEPVNESLNVSAPDSEEE
ncbi:MAG: tRNA pseudouridine(55) synthase TruB [Bacteroidota bacterium]|jgi:tRNA pseudouridine55 synthase